MIKDQNVANDAAINPSKIAGELLANRLYCFGDTDGASYNWWKDKVKRENLFTSLATAFAAMKNDSNSIGRNDILYLGPDSNTLAATIDWNKNLCHLKGMYPEAVMNQRARIGHSANFTPLMTVSGYGNLFQNIYWMHGRGNAGNLVGLSVTGNRNSFVNCHIGGPMNDTEAGTAAYKLLSITGQENYFRNCTIGVDTIAQTAANCLVSFEAGSARTVFDNCIFLSWASGSGSGSFFVKAQALADRFAIFRNCTFLNWAGGGGCNKAYAFSIGSSSAIFALHNPLIVGCDDVVAAAQEAQVKISRDSDTATNIGLAAQPDVS